MALIDDVPTCKDLIEGIVEEVRYLVYFGSSALYDLYYYNLLGSIFFACSLTHPRGLYSPCGRFFSVCKRLGLLAQSSLLCIAFLVFLG